jgi:antitoxin YefM
MTISASEARKDLFPLIKRVNDDHTPVRISSKSGEAVLMSADDYDSWQETVYLLRSPANARSLMEAVSTGQGLPVGSRCFHHDSPLLPARSGALVVRRSHGGCPLSVSGDV